jgi:hypothetical protein
MRKTGIDDEAIKSGQNMLLTFRNIRNESGKNNDIFNQSSKILLDMTAAMHGGEVTQEAMRKQAVGLGKALNDPIKGMTALQRVGVSFTDQQKKQITTLVESGNRLGAQKIILRELGKEFGGSAAAMATPLQKMKTAFGEVEENIGTALLPVVTKLANFILRDLLPQVQAFIPTIMGWVRVAIPKVTEAIGFFLVGLRAIIKFISNLPGPIKIAAIAVTALGIALKVAAANPWTALIVGTILLVGIIVKNWAKIKAAVNTALDAIKGAALAVWNWIKRNWPLLLAILTGPFGLAVKFVIDHWNTVKKVTSGLIQALRNLFAAFVDRLLGLFGTIIHGAANAFGWIPGIGGKLKGAASAFDRFRRNVNASLRGIDNRSVHVKTFFNTGANPSGFAIRAMGGPVKGPGGPTDDRAGLFALSNNEYVIRASAHRKYGTRFLDAVNAGRLAAGGAVGVHVSTSFPSRDEIAFSSWRAVGGLARAWAKQFLASAGPGGSVERWRGLVLAVLAAMGLSAAWVGTVLRRMNQESGGNPRAINLWDINAQMGDPSRGLMQTIGSTFNTYAGPYRFLGIYNPWANVWAALHYTLARYGSLAALNQPGGYADGGIITEPIFGVGRSGRTYTFGERGYETVTPGRGMGNTYIIHQHISPGVSKAEVGAGLVDAIKAYERGNGKKWRS